MAEKRVGFGRRGYTLMEMVVVLMILAISGAVVVPALARQLRGGAEAVARELVGIYRTPRDVAAARGVPATVTLELGTGRYRVIAEPALAPAPDTVRSGTLGVTGGVRLRGGHDGWVVCTFHPYGRARCGAVVISDSEGRFEVSADAWTAAIDVRRH